MIKTIVFLFIAAIFLYFAGNNMFRTKESWRHVADLPENFNEDCVSVNNDGLGIIGGNLDTFLLSKQKAILWRLEGEVLEKTYEAKGYIVAIQHADSHWFVIAGTLKAPGPGTDYRLLVSSDNASTWNEAGGIPAISIVQIVPINPSLIYVFGTETFMVTEDGGKSWSTLQYPGVAEGRGFKDSIVPSHEGTLLAFDAGLEEMEHGSDTWKIILDKKYHIEAINDPFFTAVVNEKLYLFKRDGLEVKEISNLPYDRFPFRISVNDNTVRILTQPRSPEKLGFFSGGLGRVLLRSDNRGRSWKNQKLGSIQKADISGANIGIGVDIRRRIFSTIGRKK